MRFNCLCLSVFVIAIGIELTKCDCDTFYECAGGLFNDFFNRFTSISSKNADYAPTVKDFITNGSLSSGFRIGNSDKRFDKVFQNLIYSVVKDFEENETGAVELFKIDLSVPNVNSTVFVETIQNDISNFGANIPSVESEGGADKVDINANIPWYIAYDNNITNIEHGDIKEIVVKTNAGNNIEHNLRDDSRRLSILDEILRDYENDYPDNSTDYQTIDYVKVYEDRIEAVEYDADDVDTITLVQDKNFENHSKESKQDFENIIGYSDNSVYDTIEMNNDYDTVESNERDRGLSKNMTSVKTTTKLRMCNESEFRDNMEDSVFSWTAAIFIKLSNDTDFSYSCDGIVLTEKYVITARKCFNNTSSEDNVLLVTGKRSLRNIGEGEAAYKIKKLIFQNETNENNLAIIETEIDIEFNSFVESACISLVENNTRVDPEKAIAIGYNATYDLIVLSLVENLHSGCSEEASGEGDATKKKVYCMNVQEGEAICPNLGSVYVSISTIPSKLNLIGILTDRPDDCHQKLSFTPLLENIRWIEEIVNS